MAQGYTHPERLVETDWVAAHAGDPDVRVVESDEDYLLYEVGHIPGSVKMDWFTVLQDPVRRDFLNQDAFETLCQQAGISNETTVVFYGDKSNWFACYSLWIFEYYGHKHCKIMNGGRQKWEKEGRDMTKELPQHPGAAYTAQTPDPSIRAFRDEVFQHVDAQGALVDVRSPKEYTGELLHMPGYPQEGAQRGGHIPGALSIPWVLATNEADGTFKSADELKTLYEDQSVTSDRDVIAYCRIGERSSHTWFTLKYLLGYPNVKNYDGSWTEWGNLVNAPIEK